MKRYRLSLILISLLFMTSVIGLLSVNGLAQTDLNYSFEQETIYNYPLHQTTNDFNLKNNELLNYTQTYNATYSFTDDTIGQDPLDWDITEGGNGNIEVVSEIYGHSKVLMLNDTSVGSISAVNDFDSTKISGTFELWIRTNDATKRNYVSLKNAATFRFYVMMYNDLWYYNDGSETSTGIIASDNTWYHIKFDFEHGAGSYLGLGADTWNLHINGFKISDLSFMNSGIDADTLSLGSASTDANYIYHYDAIGYSWDANYDLGDNIMPLHSDIDVINEWEVDRWIFSFNDSLDDQYAVGSDVFSDWDEIDGGDDDTNIVSDPLASSNRLIKLNHQAPDTEDLGIEREFSIVNGYVNVSWAVEFDSWGGSNEFSMKIYSFDDTLIADVYFENAQLRTDTVIFHLGLTLNVYYELNLFINYDSDNAVLRLSGDGVYIGTYMFSLFSVGKDGLGKIESFVDHSAINDMVCYLDYIGVYVNGSSLSTELAFKRFRNLEWNAQTWVFNEHNLIYFEGYGDIILWETSPIWLIGVVDTSLLSERYFVNGTLRVFNIYGHLRDGLYTDVDTPSLFVQFFDELNISDITIEGVKLNQGSNKYPLEFTYGNVDINESYFYVDSSNRLRGQCFYNDNETEYIQASFDIDDVLNENRSLRFRARVSGQYGFFGLSYTDATSSIISLSVRSIAHNLILPQAKTIDEFVFLISDDGNLEAGYGSGMIYDIELIWNPSISITILTTSLIMVIIPIIIMIVPTLTLYSRYGKSVIMPVFIFMSVICFAGGLIPAWLFFILMVSAGGFIVLKKGSDE